MGILTGNKQKEHYKIGNLHNFTGELFFLIRLRLRRRAKHKKGGNILSGTRGDIFIFLGGDLRHVCGPTSPHFNRDFFSLSRNPRHTPPTINQKVSFLFFLFTPHFFALRGHFLEKWEANFF